MLFSEVKKKVLAGSLILVYGRVSQWGYCFSQRARGSTACGHIRNLSYPNRTGTTFACVCVCVGGGGGGGGGNCFLIQIGSIQFV